MSPRWLIAVSGVAHLAVGVGLFVSGVWHLERVHADPVHHEITVPVILPEPSGGRMSGADVKIPPKPHPHTPKDRVQPVAKPVDPTPPDSPDSNDGKIPGPGSGSGDPTNPNSCTENCGEAKAAAPMCGNGSVEAAEQCDDGNTLDGDGCSSTCRIEAPKPKPAIAAVLPSVLQGLRVSGETQLHPSEATQSSMIRDGASHVSGTVRVCISTDGGVTSARMVKTTRYDQYDATILSAVKDWRYRPYTLEGTPVPACSFVTFHYTIQ
jgi:TonB family protein